MAGEIVERPMPSHSRGMMVLVLRFRPLRASLSPAVYERAMHVRRFFPPADRNQGVGGHTTRGDPASIRERGPSAPDRAAHAKRSSPPPAALSVAGRFRARGTPSSAENDLRL